MLTVARIKGYRLALKLAQLPVGRRERCKFADLIVIKGGGSKGAKTAGTYLLVEPPAKRLGITSQSHFDKCYAVMLRRRR